MRRLENAHLRHLARCWSTLRLTVETPDRFPSWDAVVLTAASERQAALYEQCLLDARRRGVLAERVRTLVAPDPGGRRIGSGGATLHALRELARRHPDAARGRVLLLHSGGDSRRVPWANIFGKAFLPAPLLADPDHPVPALFDHLLAVSAPLSLALPAGGLLTLTGDVLPLFDPGRVRVPEHGALVLTTPVPLDLAAKHGVIVADAQNVVSELLQKATPSELANAGALVQGGSALLDTGIWAFTGSAFEALTRAATEPDGALDRLLAEKRSCSLYEEIAWGFVPGNRPQLEGIPWARSLATHLAGESLTQHRTDEMLFLHFGSTAEILEHFSRSWFGSLTGRILAEDGAMTAQTARVYESSLHPDTRVGWGSLVVGSRLSEGTRIGHRSVIAGVDDGGEALTVPDSRCLWEVPVRDGPGDAESVVFACCGVDDNPSDPFEQATFCNQDFAQWLAEHKVEAEQLWPAGERRVLWTARLFPVQPLPASLQVLQWLLGNGSGPGAARGRAAWFAAERISLDALHRRADFARWAEKRGSLRAGIILRALNRIVGGLQDRNVHALVGQLGAPGLRRRALSLADQQLAGPWRYGMPASASRRLQVQADLLAGGGDEAQAATTAERAFHAVQDEVARAVTFHDPVAVEGLAPGRRAEVRLPVRFDISGGWSDTPPYCLERPALVLNLALMLDGERPVCAAVEALPQPEWELEVADLGARVRISDPAQAAPADGLEDPFVLLKTALRITGYGTAEGGITQGVRVRTRAAVPKGSGLGTSSILGAALVKALQQLAGRPDDTRTVSDLVLVLEQQMRTGGGWQDQIGGLVPGVKCISTRPVRPLRMRIDPVPLLPAVVDELQQRLVIAFTGQQRLARNILQIVVERYLRREARTLSAINELVELAADGRGALAMGRLDDLGEVLGNVWQVLQQLTPECSNPRLDALFRAVEDLSLGGKLAGAGGGGFMGVLARDPGAAARIRERLAAADPHIRIYEWRLWTADGNAE